MITTVVNFSFYHSLVLFKDDSSCPDCPDRNRFTTFFQNIQKFTFLSDNLTKSSDNLTLNNDGQSNNNSRYQNDEMNILINEYHEKIVRLLNAKYCHPIPRYSMIFCYSYTWDL